jgi:hypothetical protein
LTISTLGTAISVGLDGTTGSALLVLGSTSGGTTGTVVYFLFDSVSWASLGRGGLGSTSTGTTLVGSLSCADLSALGLRFIIIAIEGAEKIHPSQLLFLI